MKRIMISLFCTAMAAIACTKESEYPAVPDNQDAPRTVTLDATMPSTRVAVDSEGKVTWSSADAIAVWNTDGDKFEFTIDSGAGTEVATFKCTTFTGDLGTKAVYPYAWAGSTEGTITVPHYIEWVDGYVPAVMASRINTISEGVVSPLYFNSMMAIIKFTLQDVPAYACGFKLWSAAGAQLCGDYTVNSDCTALENVPTGNTEQITYFPYKTGYGSDATVDILAAIPAYNYTDLKLRIVDGDVTGSDAIIYGRSIPSSNFSGAGFGQDAFITMPVLNIRSLAGTRSYVKVEGVKWAKGNLRAWKSGTTGTGWQTGWNIYDNQWESQFSLTRTGMDGTSLTSLTLNTSTFKEESVYTHWDYFSWGTLARASRVHNTVITSSAAEFDICGKVFSGASGDISAMSELEGDDRFADTGGFTSNPSICGDLAFWASKGQYRLPQSSELQLLYSKNNAGNGSDHAHMQAGYFMDENNNMIRGILFTSCPSWETTIYNKTAIEFTTADMESGLFIPKSGERTTNNNTYDANSINFFNGWGVYWSGTYGGLNSGYEDCARHINFTGANEMTYGYTSKLSNTITGQTKLGNCIRPVYIQE